LAAAGWLNRHRQRILDYLRDENRIFREQLAGRRPRLTDDQRRRPAVKGKMLDRKLLGKHASLVTPDTILRWHRRLAAPKCDFSQRRGGVGRPRVMVDVRTLVLRMARTNPWWGYTRSQGALKNLGHEVGRTTVANNLKERSLDGADRREGKATRHGFLRTHCDCLVALDSFTIEVWTMRGLIRYYVLLAMEVGTRRIEIAGITPCPAEAFMVQVARILTDEFEDLFQGKRYAIVHRGGTFTHAFRRTLREAGVKPVRLPARCPNLNSQLERSVRSIREECLERMILFGESMLRRAAKEYLDHYHAERNHQGLENRLIAPGPEAERTEGRVVCRKRLGGLLRHHYRQAA